MTHRESQNKIIELNACGFKKDCINRVNEKYNKLSEQNDLALSNACNRPSASGCINKMSDALDYVGNNTTAGYKTDLVQSRKRVLDIANSTGYQAISNLDMRANYFGAMYGYTGQPWFRVAESESRNWLSLKGADETFYSDWIAEAGAVIMKNGKKEFQDIYKNHQNKTLSWSYWRLVNEQNDPELQKVHERYYNSWLKPIRLYVDYQVGGNFLNPKNRVAKGCEDMQEVKECQK